MPYSRYHQGTPGSGSGHVRQHHEQNYQPPAGKPSPWAHQPGGNGADMPGLNLGLNLGMMGMAGGGGGQGLLPTPANLMLNHQNAAGGNSGNAPGPGWGPGQHQQHHNQQHHNQQHHNQQHHNQHHNQHHTQQQHHARNNSGGWGNVAPSGGNSQQQQQQQHHHHHHHPSPHQPQPHQRIRERDKRGQRSYYSRERSPPRSNRSFRRSRSRSRGHRRHASGHQIPRTSDNRRQQATSSAVASSTMSAAAHHHQQQHQSHNRDEDGASANERAEHEIYIGNYPVKFKVGDVRRLFEQHDIQVGTIRLKYDGRKVFAFAETVTQEMVEKAVQAMDSKEIFGRRLRVRSAADKDKGQQSHKRELQVGDVTRHLAFAFNGFLSRQIESCAQEKANALRQVQDTLKEAFQLPDDDSLKISRDLELIFMQNNRREIPIPPESRDAAVASTSQSDNQQQSQPTDPPAVAGIVEKAASEARQADPPSSPVDTEESTEEEAKSDQVAEPAAQVEESEQGPIVDIDCPEEEAEESQVQQREETKQQQQQEPEQSEPAPVPQAEEPAGEEAREEPTEDETVEAEAEPEVAPSEAQVRRGRSRGRIGRGPRRGRVR